MGFTTVIPPADQRQYLVVLDPCINFPEGRFRGPLQARDSIFLAQHFEYARARGENWSWIDAIEAAKLLRSSGATPDPNIADKLKQAREILKDIQALATANVDSAIALPRHCRQKSEHRFVTQNLFPVITNYEERVRLFEARKRRAELERRPGPWQP